MSVDYFALSKYAIILTTDNDHFISSFLSLYIIYFPHSIALAKTFGIQLNRSCDVSLLALSLCAFTHLSLNKVCYILYNLIDYEHFPVFLN